MSNYNITYSNIDLQGSVNKLFSDNVTIINKTHLNIDRPSDKDEGIYECRATGFNNKSASKLYNVRIGGKSYGLLKKFDLNNYIFYS